MAQLILPLSLFLGVLMTFSKLYTESEITVMHACGLGKRVLVVSALILALLTSALAAVNVIWLMPWSSKYQEHVVADAKANPSLAAIMEGRFKPSTMVIWCSILATCMAINLKTYSLPNFVPLITSVLPW